ncbi:MAG TPA: CHAT domain-containing protein [Pseudomonadota bacterium]|nr:CHAT domain-containing protein [Pseudomonadota bacterium]HRI49402.1 CHAT domain-containing protein [Pseudomonadota bacterium]
MLSSPIALELEFARADKAEDPFAFGFAPQDYLLRTAGGGFERSPLNWSPELLADLEAVRKPGQDSVILQRLGETLRRFLIPLGWAELALQLEQACSEQRRVFLTIRSAAAELYALPWELLTLKKSGQHLGELQGVLLRYEWPETTTTAELPTPRQGGGRILLAWSAAGGAVPATEHQRAISAACQASSYPFDAARDVLPQFSLGRLRAALAAAKKDNQPIAVLHLLAHGSKAGSTFGLVIDGESAADGPVVVDAAKLRQFLAPYASMVRLVVLMACDSGNVGALGNQLGSVAQTLHRAGVAAVVSSRYPLSVAGSVRLAESLYSGLLIGPDSLENTLLAARDELVKDTQSLDWVSVQLYARCADGEDTRPLVFRPYQGLSSFSIEHSRFYFGRAALTGSIWQRCNDIFMRPRARLLAVLGPSGSGKSSVARAGLLAELTRRQLPAMPSLHAAILKPGDRPLRALERALAELPLAAAESAVLVFVDQFEEVYTLCSDPQERDAFVALLLQLADDPARRSAVVLTLRSDFFGETQRFHRDLNQLIAAQHELVPALNDEQLRQAIAEPARRAGRPLDGATVDLLLQEAGESEGALPILQFALTQIWEGLLAGKRAAATLREIGGVGGALASNAKEIYGSLSPSEQATARRALVRLVKLGEGTRDTRRRAPVDELCGRGQTAADVLVVLRKFAAENARLVTLSGTGAETLAEVTHEALFDHWAELRKWIDEGRVERRFYDRLTAATRLWNEDRGGSGRLWRPPDLDLLRAYAARRPEDLSTLDTEFLRASEEAQQAALIEKQEAEHRLRDAHERLQQQLLSTFVEQGRRLLVETQDHPAALLWLHRAHSRGSRDAILPELLRDAMRCVDAVQLVLVGHRGRLLNARYNSTGCRIVTTSEDQTARVWNAETGRLVAELRGHEARVRSATFSPDDRYILTASEDSSARVWDAETGQLVADFQGHGDKVWNAMFSPDGRRVLTASSDKTARIWEVATRHLVAEFRGHEDSVSDAAFSPDGSLIVTASWDKTACIWEAETGRLMAEMKGHTESVWRANFSPDGQLIATASTDCTARVWDVEAGRLVAECKGHAELIRDATFSPCCRRLVTASHDKTARVWEAETGRVIFELKAHTDKVKNARFSPDGCRILTAGSDSTTRIWDAATGRLLHELSAYGDSIRRARFSPDGRHVLTASSNSTRVWAANTGRMLMELADHTARVRSATYSADGRRILTTSADTKTRVWEAETGRLLTVMASQEASVNSARYSPDSRCILTTTENRAAVWEVETGRQLITLTGHQSSVHGATYSPDGHRILTASCDKTARVWDAKTGCLLMELRGHSAGVNSAAYSTSGHLILTASEDKTTRLWDAETGRQIGASTRHRNGIFSAMLSPDGRHIVVASDDETARVWDATTGRLLTELKGHEATVNSAVYSSDGRRIVTASADKTARVWDAETGRLLAELKGHGASVWSATFSPDNCRVLTASVDRTARIWDVSPEKRTAEQIAQQIRRRLLVRFESEDSNVIIATTPAPADG